jgi:hypothetical protein
MRYMHLGGELQRRPRAVAGTTPFNARNGAISAVEPPAEHEKALEDRDLQQIATCKHTPSGRAAVETATCSAFPVL